MFRIDFSIPEKTFLLEKSRKLEIMDIEDITYWCFLAQIHFKTPSQSLLLLTEASLFQIVDGLSVAMKKISTENGSQTLIDDRYGGFIMYIEKTEELILISEEFKRIMFQIPIKDFIEGVKDFISSVIIQTKILFPNLNLNQNYINAVKNWETET